MQKRTCITICLLTMFLFLYGCGKRAVYVSEFAEETKELLTTEQATETVLLEDSTPETYVVYVCGAVKHAGVYELSAGSRVYEAILLAGGLTEDASEDCINQAEKITDGQMIKIWRQGEMMPEKTGLSAESAKGGKVNLNTADKQMLMTIPGIGEAKAQSIIDYREEQGMFETIEDVKNITGIKDGLYTKMKEYITVR